MSMLLCEQLPPPIGIGAVHGGAEVVLDVPRARPVVVVLVHELVHVVVSTLRMGQENARARKRPCDETTAVTYTKVTIYYFNTTGEQY